MGVKSNICQDAHIRLDKQRENKSSSPRGERIEVRGNFKGTPSSQPSPAKAGEGDVCDFCFEKIKKTLLR